MWLTLLILFLLIGLIYFYMTKNYSYWKNKNVLGPKPRFLIGNFPSIVNKKIHNMDEISDIYREYKGKTPVVGIYQGVKASLLVIDPEVAKKIMITDFSHFTDTTGVFDISKESDPLVGRNPFFLKGEEWKEKRAEILPAFTSGRIKALFPIMQEVADRMKIYIEKELKIQDEFETRELCAKYTTDVVTCSIYGVESGAFTNEHSEIRDVARNVLAPSIRLFIILFVTPFFPGLSKFVKVKFCPDKEANFLTKLLNDTLKYRIDNKIERQDYLDFLIHLREKKGLSDIEITAHTLSFFFDGIETSSITLSFILYELAKNKKQQEKLRAEMMKIRDANGKFEYDSLVENKYLDQVMYESLRLHPVLYMHFRECTKEYELPLPNNNLLTIEKGTQINIAVRDMEMDSDYYGPTANEFNPERFNEENGGLKAFRDKTVLFPFGDGPRTCLGQRFAQTQIKCCIAHILTLFELSVSEKMPQKPEYNPLEMMLCFKGGILLKFKPINA